MFDHFFDNLPNLLKSLPNRETPVPELSPEKILAFHSLPTSGGPAYHRVQANIKKIILESILQQATANPSHIITLSDIGRQASTHPDYIPFNEEYIPTLLEKYIADGLIEQERHRNTSIILQNFLPKAQALALILALQDEPFELKQSDLFCLYQTKDLISSTKLTIVKRTTHFQKYIEYVNHYAKDKKKHLFF